MAIGMPEFRIQLLSSVECYVITRIQYSEGNGTEKCNESFFLSSGAIGLCRLEASGRPSTNSNTVSRSMTQLSVNESNLDGLLFHLMSLRNEKRLKIYEV